MGAAVTLTAMIEGVQVRELRQVVDERGSVLHMLRCDAPGYTQFGECYFSEILPGAIKAWKRHRVQTQQFAVPIGRIRLVIYDDREGSSSRGRVEALELGRPDGYSRVTVPPGLWYGFACAGTAPALLANCPDVPHESAEVERRPDDDPSIPYVWSGMPAGTTGA